MKQTFLAKAAELMRSNMRRRRWHRVCTGLAAAVVFVTTYMLILPAITMESETICGMAEHSHTDACYELRLVCTQEELPEGAEVHVHGPECYEEQQVQTCTLTEGEGHAHSESCYGIACGREEHAGHTHTDACYTETSSRELTCTEAERGGHTHGEGCRDESGNLICTESEDGGHTHSESCYTDTVTRELTCGQEEAEGHTHSDACIGLTCGQETSEGHAHTETCFSTQQVLACPQSAAHVHGDGCYEKVLLCEIPEHTHTDECSTVVEEIPEEELPLAAFPERLPEGYVEYTFDNEAGLTVTAYAPEDAFGQDVQLFAQVLAEDSEAYAQAKENLDNAEHIPEYTGMAALDIRFVDASVVDPAGAEEIEPDAEMGQIFVKIDAQALLPEDVDESTLAVQHHAKASDGGMSGTGSFEHTDVVVETVADSSEETGDITVTPGEAVLPETLPAPPEPLPAPVDESGTEEDAALDAPVAEPEEIQPAVMDVEAAFAVNSFSTFTITWVDGGNRKVILHYVDENGVELQTSAAPTGVKTVTGVGNVWLSNYAALVSGYMYQSAHLNGVSGTAIAKISYNYESSAWFYTTPQATNNWIKFATSEQEKVDVYLVYAAVEELAEVDTVDSTAKGVYMYMFDYKSAANIGGGAYGNGETKLGLATRTTSGTGINSFPETVNGNTSFSKWFNPDNGTAANHLFLQDVYDDTGYFYYSAFENFATIKNSSDGNFTVYEQLGSPSNAGNYYYKRGNFMPYNTLDNQNIINRNLYDAEGQALSEEDPAYNKPLYGFNETNNFYFGMYIYAQFYQPKDGLYNDQEMVFNFTGDDDMWVYIDGVLVLDLGGIHDAQSGYINFTTGEVGYTVTMTNQNPAWSDTTIRSQFVEAQQADAVKWDPDRTNTFADGTMHTIQIFYMERGEGASNLKINFNLPTVPDGSLAVRKDVENYFDAQMQEISYQMQLLDKDEKAMAGEPYYLMGDETNLLHTDENGKFWLRHNQTAVFNQIDGNEQVTIKEVAIQPEDENRLDKYHFSYTVTDSTGEMETGGSEDKEVAVTMPPAGSASVTVNNRATFTAPVTVTKHFQGTTGNAAPEGFDAVFTVYELHDGEKTEIGSVNYSKFKNGSYTFWLEEGKTYQIEEVVVNNGDTDSMVYRYTTVQVDGGSATEGTAVTVDLPKNSGDGKTVTYTNVYSPPYGDLSIVKRVVRTDGAEPGGSGFRFQITVQNADGTTNAQVSGPYTATRYGVTFTEDGYSKVDAGRPETVTFANGVAEITLDHGQMLTILNLPAASKAMIQEINTDGYSVKWTTSNNEMATQANATVTSSELIGDPVLICTNTTGAVLPSTGGMGTTPFLALGSLCMFGAGMLLLSQRRRKGEGTAG